MRIPEMITKRKMLDLFTNSRNRFFRNCVEISLENLFFDIGALWVLIGHSPKSECSKKRFDCSASCH